VLHQCVFLAGSALPAVHRSTVASEEHEPDDVLSHSAAFGCSVCTYNDEGQRVVQVLHAFAELHCIYYYAIAQLICTWTLAVNGCHISWWSHEVLL